MKLINTKIKDGPKIIKSKIYNDKRGFLRELIKDLYLKIKILFLILCLFQKKCFKRIAFTNQKPQAKIITVTQGKNF